MFLFPRKHYSNFQYHLNIKFMIHLYVLCIFFIFWQNNHLDKVNEPTYLVTLKTEEGDGQGTQDIQFACSIEQLQVSRLCSFPPPSLLKHPSPILKDTFTGLVCHFLWMDQFSTWNNIYSVIHKRIKPTLYWLYGLCAMECFQANCLFIRLPKNTSSCGLGLQDSFFSRGQSPLCLKKLTEFAWVFFNNLIKNLVCSNFTKLQPPLAPVACMHISCNPIHILSQKLGGNSIDFPFWRKCERKKDCGLMENRFIAVRVPPLWEDF